MKKLIKKIQNFSFRNNFWKEGDNIVLGISGGPDSVCLLDILVKIAEKKKLEIIMAHINYGLRGGDSDKDEIFVRKLAEKYNLKLEILDAKKQSQKKSDENSLRKIRYDFFEKIRKENNFDLIAVAHNQDDQAETVLMRMIRGAGLLGLSGIRPKNNKIIHPLLKTSREEIVAYLKENKLKYRLDKTNLESKFLRNKIRNKLIPFLEKKYNSQIKNVLASAAENIAEDYDFIISESDKKFKQVKFNAEKNAYFFASKKFLTWHPSLQKNVLRKIILEIKKDLKKIDSAHIEEILKIIKSDKNKTQKMNFKGLKIDKKGDIIWISWSKLSG